MSPSAEFAARMERVSRDEIISEAEACRRAGVSKGIVAAARSRSGKLNWDAVMSLTRVLVAAGYRREWLLFGEGDRLAGTSGDVIRLGPGANVAAEGPVVTSSLKKRGGKRDGAAAHQAPAAGQNGRRPKRLVSGGNVDHR